MSTDTSAYFIPRQDGLHPVPAARSPWAADMLHGRLLAGLAARAVEADGHDPELSVTRLTVDMFRSPPMLPMTVATNPVRDGRRVRVTEISIRCANREVARASALLLRRSEHPVADIWRTPNWDAPSPETMTSPDTVPSPDDGDASGGWDIRMVTEGGFWTAEPKRLWTRDRSELVAGEELSPVVRAALAADLPNPLANSGTKGLQFINADLTMFLGRSPTSEWIGLEVTEHIGHDGIAIGSCRMYDTSGPIGWSSVCAIATAATIGD